MNKTARDYLSEPYSRTLIPAGDGTYFAEITEFRGCFAEGQTPAEAYTNLERVAESWIEAALSQGQEIPAPFAIHDFSGRTVLRIPRSIHKQAAKFAEMDDTSLNQFFLTAIAARVGAEDFAEHLYNRLEAIFATALTSSTIFNFIGSVNMITTKNSISELGSGGLKLDSELWSGGPKLAGPGGQFSFDKEAGNG